MKRTLIKIDREKCSGCGLCVRACHEEAIGMIDGKATLLRDDYCDGLGNCLPVCPTGAISFEEREALPFDEAATQKKPTAEAGAPMACGCPGSNAKSLHRTPVAKTQEAPSPSELMQWPVQIRLAPIQAPYFENANLLIAADCAAYAYGRFHQDFMRNKVTVIGCPKLDDTDYSEKLTALLQANAIKSVTIVRMEVPCCGGLEYAVKAALQNSEKMIPWQVVTLATDGTIWE